MAETHNLKHYKDAKVYVKHLEAILKIIDLSIRGLNNFQAYKSVARILITLQDEKITLECHLKQCKKIIESKGNYIPDKTYWKNKYEHS